MGNVIDREHEKLWESIETLANIDEEQATIVFKLAVERSLREIDSFTPTISAIPLSLPDHETLLKMKQLDRNIRRALNDRKREQAYEFLLDYIDLLSQATGENPEHVKRKMISSVLAKRSPRRAAHLTARHSPKPRKNTDTESLFYSTTEAARKLGLSDQTIRRMCEKGKFSEARQTEGGHWRIPKAAFITTAEQDERANQILEKIDAKNRAAGPVDEFKL
ncbi:helix-turn-helix domain-containing protein [Metaplanococcus flavidus]|uniref:Helix-turn-helix domain-containing protein n=1 Tax=Metaplanococcus flavidus TaxID=569883 RepID=A0ABW3LEE6_9BACL